MILERVGASDIRRDTYLVLAGAALSTFLSGFPVELASVTPRAWLIVVYVAASFVGMLLLFMAILRKRGY